MSSKVKQIEVVSTSTGVDFFSKLKNTILANTNFELLEESTDPDSLSLTFDTKLYDFKLRFKSTATTTTSSTSANIYFENDSRAISTSLTAAYTNSNAYSSSISTRKLNIFIYENDNFYMIQFLPYSVVSRAVSYSYATFGKLIAKDIANSTEREKILFATTLYDALESTSNTVIQRAFNNNSCESIVMNELILTDTTTTTSTGINGTLKEYCPHLFNCTNVSSGYRYNINGKTYFAIDKNILVAE